MPQRPNHTPLAPIRILFMPVLVALCLCACQPKNTGTTSPRAEASSDAGDTTSLFVQCGRTLDAIRRMDPDRVMDYFIEDAQGVMIFPFVFKAGFIGGAQGGKGVMVARQGDGFWSAPAFYSLGGGSFGYQAGVQRLRLVLVFMDRQGMLDAIRGGLTLDNNYSWSVLNGGEAGMISTATMNNGCIAFLEVEGLYAGVSLQGGFIKPEDGRNAAYHGIAGVTPEDILLTPLPAPMQAAPIYQALERAVQGLAPGKSIQLYP